jgi:hypothetical protein
MSAVLILKSSQQLRILPLQILEKCYKLEANNCGTDNGVSL